MCRYTIRTLTDGLATDHEEDYPHIAEAYFSSTRDYVRRDDRFHEHEVTVQLLDNEAEAILYEATKPAFA